MPIFRIQAGDNHLPWEEEKCDYKMVERQVGF